MVTNYVIEFTQCVGPSMLPTLNMAGDWVLIDKTSVWRNKTMQQSLRNGDVIVCVSPANPNKMVCKRIIGMPGDCILVDPAVSSKEFVQVPTGHVWVQGDNYSNSTDSRVYGPVSLSLIKGTLLAVVHDTWKIAVIKNSFEIEDSEKAVLKKRSITIDALN